MCRKAIALKKDYAETYNTLGLSLELSSRFDEAELSFIRAIKYKPNFPQAYNNLGNLLKNLGRLKEAYNYYNQALRLKPDFAEVSHILASLNGNTTKTAPKDYIEKLFDKYALNFEDSLVDKLGYNIHKVIANLILQENKGASLGSVLDLGCGTGLAGLEVSASCEYLEGIDLSNSMLEEAKNKKVYDKLIHQDIVEYLSNANLNFNYFLATDVFVYVGDLLKVFELIKYRNKSVGRLAFSTEHSNGDAFYLQQSGRYAHSKKYIEDLCKNFDCKLKFFEKRNLRKEKDNFISGGVYIVEF